ncbi:translation initiation factor IF-2 [Trachypithecus francoisi]|uniref:translation initiation factor IF-2 n=1 Tax=Trachypithecus francoisi TaxID=54180 RepID=UPI00141AC461|nr:translation initiation factor IF-2 [Trachypithecus francoisi]
MSGVPSRGEAGAGPPTNPHGVASLVRTTQPARPPGGDFYLGGSQEATCRTVGHGTGGQACPSRPPASSEAPLSGKCGEVPAPGASPRPPPFFPTLQTRGRQGHGGGAGASRPRGSPPPPGPEPQGGARRGRRPGRGTGSDFLLCGRVTRRGSRCGPGARRGAAARPYLAISAPPEPRPPPPGSPARGSAVPARRRPESRRTGGGSNGRGAPARRSWPYLVKEAADWRAGQRGGGGAAPGCWSGPAPPRGWGGSRAWGASAPGESRGRGRWRMRGCLPLGSGRAAGASRARPGAHGAQGPDRAL